ncbi:MAG: cache domain-containing protein, partial [Proteobacteria bacterium]|nr:cache domain-containing protein [Pseudomonadota bacterium]
NSRFEFVRTQIARKEGYIEYDWQNPGETISRSKALYMVYFEPLDWIISVSSYRDEFYELLDPKDFHDVVSSLQFGESGYAYVFNKEGKALIHPRLEYLTNLLQFSIEPDILESMLSRGSGQIEYTWKNPEELESRRKIAVFESLPEYGWTVVSSAYLDEIMSPVKLIINLGYISILVLFIAASVAVYFLSGRLSKPIDAMIHQLDENTKNGRYQTLPVYNNDELGRLAQEFNTFFGVLDTQSEHLRRERERYQSLFEASPDAVYLLKGLEIVDCNPATCKIFNSNKDELLGHTVADLSPTTQANNESSWGLAERITQESLRYKLQTFEWIHKTMDGRLFDAEVRLKPFGTEDGELLLVAFVRDITERKRDEEALRLTQFTFDKASFGIFRSGSSAEILNVNEQACYSLGYTKEELCRMSLFDIDPSLTPDSFANLRRKRSETGGIAFETLHRAKDGRTFPVHITSNLLEYDGEQYAISFVRDISEEKKIEKQKSTMEAHFRQAQRMEALGTLAGGIAHDFNNILSAIFGYTELTKMECKDNKKIQAYLTQLHAAGTRAKNLVQQILSFSRQGNTEKNPVDISKVINEAIELIRVSTPSTIEIVNNVDKYLGTVFANETQIHQVVMNLCTNACHAMEEKGGRLKIDLLPVTISSQDLSNYPDLNPGRYLKLIVSDTGYGINPDKISKIFDPYFTTKQIGEGTGLGLSTVHGIVKDHDGSVKVYSEVNKGSAFQVLLPLVESEADQSIEIEERLPRGTETILFVDDEKLLIDIGKELLKGLGYSVETRASSLDAYEAFRANPEKYDLVVSDMTMPKLTGEQLAMKIQEIDPDLPIILCTGFSSRLNTEELEKVGVKKILMKPITLMELAVAVRTVLDEPRSIKS